MSEEQESADAVTLDQGTDDDELVDVLDSEIEDFDDEAADLDDDPQAFDDDAPEFDDPPPDDDDFESDELASEGVGPRDLDGLEFDLDVGFAGGNGDGGGEPEVDFEFDDGGDGDAGMEAELLGTTPGTAVIAAPSAAIAAAPDPRVARLEATARALSEAEVTRERRRVRRKVSAATTGAGAIGLIPILLQVIDALHLSPELAALASTGAALLGAFLGGYITPEREQPVAGSREVQDLIDDDMVASAPRRKRPRQAHKRRSHRKPARGHARAGRG